MNWRHFVEEKATRNYDLHMIVSTYNSVIELYKKGERGQPLTVGTILI